MESRRIVLLTKGYNSGRLNFKYPSPTSRLRENLVLKEIEEEEFRSIFQLTASVYSALFSSNLDHTVKAEFLKTCLDCHTHVRDLALPYLANKSKIDDEDPDRGKKLKTVHEANKKAFAELLAKRKEKNGTV